MHFLLFFSFPCLLLCFILCCLCFLNESLGVHCALTLSTPLQLREIVIGRCYETTIINANLLNRTLANNLSVVGCPELFSNFSSVWTHRDSMNVTLQDFDPFFQQLSSRENGDILFMAPKDKALFWSRTNRFAHVLSSNYPQSFMTLEDTIVGKSLNELNFCGCEQTETNRDSCQAGMELVDSCPYGVIVSGNETVGAKVSFWAQASTQFAKQATGTIQVLLSATATKAYSKRTFFGSFEVPHLSAAVTKVQVLLIKNETAGETCDRGSILMLKGDLNRRFIELGVEQLPPIECIDDFPTLKHIICADAPQSSQCTFVTQEENGFHANRKVVLYSLGSFLVGLAVGTVVILVLMVVYSSMYGNQRIQSSTLYQPLTMDTAA